MLDSFLKVAMEQSEREVASRDLAKRMEGLPNETLYKIASGQLKLSMYGCTPMGEHDVSWLDKYKGTPMFDQAVALEEEDLQWETQNQQVRVEDSAKDQLRSQMWAMRDQIGLKKKLLDLELVKGMQAERMQQQAEGEQMAAEEEAAAAQPPAAEAAPPAPAGPPAMKTTTVKEPASEEAPKTAMTREFVDSAIRKAAPSPERATKALSNVKRMAFASAKAGRNEGYGREATVQAVDTLRRLIPKTASARPEFTTKQKLWKMATGEVVREETKTAAPSAGRRILGAMSANKPAMYGALGGAALGAAEGASGEDGSAGKALTHGLVGGALAGGAGLAGSVAHGALKAHTPGMDAGTAMKHSLNEHIQQIGGKGGAGLSGKVLKPHLFKVK